MAKPSPPFGRRTNHSSNTLQGTGASPPGIVYGSNTNPARLQSGDYIEQDYINAIVQDIQDKQELIASLEDKIKAMQERIELLEDDVNES